MSVQNVSSVNSVNFKGNQANNKNKTQQPQNNVENGKNKLTLALAALGATALAGIAIYKGKGTKLSSIKFDKGMAFLQNGDKFTGKIKDKLSNGDKIVMEYVDGVLQKSTRSGQVNFEKVYETVNNEKIIKKTVNGITTEFNITKAQQNVKAAQELQKAAQAAEEMAKANEAAQQLTPEVQKPVSEASIEETVDKATATEQSVQQLTPEAENTTVTAEPLKAVQPDKPAKNTWVGESELGDTYTVTGKGDLLQLGNADEFQVKGGANKDFDILTAKVKSNGQFPYFDDMSLTKGDYKYTTDVTGENKKIKLRSANGKYKTIKRENPQKLVEHLEDGRTLVFDKNNGQWLEYDKNGNCALCNYSQEPRIKVGVLADGSSEVDVLENTASYPTTPYIELPDIRGKAEVLFDNALELMRWGK